MNSKFKLSWSATQKLVRDRGLKIYRANEKKAIYNNKARFKVDDIILIDRDYLKLLKLEKGKSLALPHYGKNDPYFDEMVEMAKSMIIDETDDHILLNKMPNVASQPGNKTKVNIPFIMNHYLYQQN